MRRILGELPQFCAWLASGKAMHDDGVSHGVCKPLCLEVMRQLVKMLGK